MNILEKILNKTDQLKEVDELVYFANDLLADRHANNKFRRFTLLTEFLNVIETITVFSKVTNEEIEEILDKYGLSEKELSNEFESLKSELAAHFE